MNTKTLEGMGIALVTMVRPEVYAFALMMEKRLREKDADKGESWKRMHIQTLKVKAITKCVQAEKAIMLGYPATTHAVDMANYCMMIADVESARDAALAERIEEGGAA